MKIDFSVCVSPEMREKILGKEGAAYAPDVVKMGHLGTHFDVMDKVFSLDNTERRGIVIDVSKLRDAEIGLADIDMRRVRENDFVMFHTGWLDEQGYGTPAYFADSPELSSELIRRLVELRVSMIGIDGPGVRRGAGHGEADRYCADRGVFVVENLANTAAALQSGWGPGFLVHTYPIAFSGMTGIPCRVVGEKE